MSEEKTITPVNKPFIEDCIKQIVKAVATGKTNIMVKNPAIEFTRLAKAGSYDHVSDETYSQMLADCEFLAITVMKKELAMSYGELLQRFLSLASEDGTGYPSSIAVSLANIIGRRTDVPINYDSYSPFGYSLFMEEDPGTDHCRSPKISDWGAVLPSDSDLTYHDPEDDSPDPSEEPKLTVTDWTPKKICNHLSRSIFGQEDAKKAASMLLWNHLKGRERNLLFVGPTGSGKTAIWEAVKQIYPYIVFADGSRITQSGWKGDYKLDSVLDSLPPQQIEHAIIVVDEADKLFSPQFTSHGENVSASIQAEFLKLIEGGTLVRDGKPSLDLKHVSWVFLGSFEEMLEKKGLSSEGRSIGFGNNVRKADAASYTDVITPDDLISYAGIRREIAGRIDGIVQLSPMTAADYDRILDAPSMSPVYQLQREYGIKIRMPEEKISKLCKEAADSGMGVRYLRSRIRCELDRKMFASPDAKKFILFAEDAPEKEA